MLRYLKKLFATIMISILAVKVFAPSMQTLMILETPPVEPFKQLIHAIGMVEAKFDTLAFNPDENAVGFFQIRPIRIEDYNKRTGSNYSVNDMFNYDIAEMIFLYYASQIGPYNFEKIAKTWNGSGPLTLDYWNRVRVHL